MDDDHIVDAAGKIPSKLTKYETKWREQLSSGEARKRYESLILRQQMPLNKKIEMSLERIREWCQAFDNSVSVSFSGGKDSAVLLWLVRQIYPDCVGIFVNTGLEYPEVIRLVKSTKNIHIVRPKMPFHQVVKQYGYPMISKNIARGVNAIKHPTCHNQNIVRLYEEGVNRFGENVSGFKVSNQWKFLINAPFEVSDKCCSIMKKEPMKRASKEIGISSQFIGTMATDSKSREKTYLQHGCNPFDMKNPRSTPMGFWTEQDVLECIYRYEIPYASVYGRIFQNELTGKWETSGVRRTGCVFCGFGLHLDEGNMNRFQRLYHTHPMLWKFCIDKMGLRDITQYITDNCPNRITAKKFKIVPDLNKYVQLSIF